MNEEYVVVLAGLAVALAGVTAISFFLPRCMMFVLCLSFNGFIDYAGIWWIGFAVALSLGVDILMSGMNPAAQMAAESLEMDTLLHAGDFRYYLGESIGYCTAFSLKLPLIRQAACLIALVLGSWVLFPRLLFLASLYCLLCRLNFQGWLTLPICAMLAAPMAYFDLFACCCMMRARELSRCRA